MALPQKQLPDGRVASVYPLMYDRARLVVGQPDAVVLDDMW
jgi:hypothetical protein